MVQNAKTERISKLTDLLREAKSIVLNDFTGLNVKDISELRKVCRKNGVTFTVVKNTLAKKSFDELGIEGLDPLLDGPTAIAISAVDEVTPAQVIKKFVDDYELPKLKGGYVSGRVISDAEVVRLATLPGRDVSAGAGGRHVAGPDTRFRRSPQRFPEGSGRRSQRDSGEEKGNGLMTRGPAGTAQRTRAKISH